MTPDIWLIGRLDQLKLVAERLAADGRLARWDSPSRILQTGWMARRIPRLTNRITSQAVARVSGSHNLMELAWRPVRRLSGRHRYTVEWLAEMNLDLLAYLSEPRSYRILHGQSAYCRWAGQLARKHGKLFVHDLYCQLPHRRRQQYADEFAAHGLTFVDISERVLARTVATAREADAVLVPSDDVRDAAIEAGIAREKLHVVPYDSPLGQRLLQRERPPRSEGPIRLLHVGAIGIEKGVAYLYNAFQQLRARHPGQFELHIAGGTRTLGEEYLTKFGDTIHYHGQLRPEALEELYFGCDVFVFPSLSEGYSLALSEALAAGLPAIVARDARGSVIDGENGLVVPPRDTQAIVAAVERLTNMPLRAHLSERARQTIRALSAESYPKRVMRVYDQLLAEQRVSQGAKSDREK